MVGHIWGVLRFWTGAALAASGASISTTVDVPRDIPGNLDATFLYEATRLSRATGWQYQSARTVGAVDPGRYNRIYDLYAAAMGLPPREDATETYASSKNFAEFRDFLKTRGNSLSSEDRLLLLSMIGYKLAAGYDRSGGSSGSETTSDALYQNAAAGGTKGGQCTQIAAFLADASNALGFDQVGMHGLVQEKEGGGQGHAVAHYRDTATGRFFAQNYGQILDTSATSLSEAIDASTRFFSVFTDLSGVESRPGRVTLYRPAESRWVDGEINHASALDPKWALVSAKVTNLDRSVVAQARASSSHAGAKAFLMHSDRVGVGGTYQVDAVGISAAAGDTARFDDSIVDELGTAASFQTGYLRYLNPAYLNGFPGKTGGGAATSPFVGAGLTGTARIDRWTGRISAEGRTLDLQPTTFGLTPSGWWNEARLGAFHPLWAELGWFGIERAFRVAPDNLIDQKWAPRTAFDRVTVVVDTRGPDDGRNRRAYLYLQGQAYALDGVEDLSSVALHEILRAALPIGTAGELAVAFESSDVVVDRFHDPLLQSLPALDIGPEWTQTLSSQLEVGASARVGNGRRPAYLFETSDFTRQTPEAGRFRGSVWIRIRF